jgi:hypothetical protein
VAVVHRSALGRGDRTSRERIPLTHPARTVADLARTTSQDLLEEAVDDLLCRRLVTLDRLERLAAPAPALVAVLAAWTPGALPGSPAEMELVRLLVEAGLGPPERQHWIAEAAARVDLAYPDSHVAMELDSFRWHGGRRPFESDRSRGNRIVAAGWRLLRATPGDPYSLVAAATRLVAGNQAA